MFRGLKETMDTICVMALLHQRFTEDGTEAQRVGANWPVYKMGMTERVGSLNLEPVSFSSFLLCSLETPAASYKSWISEGNYFIFLISFHSTVTYIFSVFLSTSWCIHKTLTIPMIPQHHVVLPPLLHTVFLTERQLKREMLTFASMGLSVSRRCTKHIKK